MYTHISLGFSKQESQGHFLRTLRVPLCNFVKFSWKLGVPAQKWESGTADLESNENPAGFIIMFCSDIILSGL